MEEEYDDASCLSSAPRFVRDRIQGLLVGACHDATSAAIRPAYGLIFSPSAKHFQYSQKVRAFLIAELLDEGAVRSLRAVQDGGSSK